MRDGSRRCVWMSTPPGKTTFPVASMRSPSTSEASSTRPAMRPSRTTMSARNVPCSAATSPPETTAELTALAFGYLALPDDPEGPVGGVLDEEVVDVVAIREPVRRVDEPRDRPGLHDDLLPLVEERCALGGLHRRLGLAVERIRLGVLPARVARLGTAVRDAAEQHVRVGVEVVAGPVHVR